MRDHKILLRKWLDQGVYGEIKDLERICLENDGIHLKLELEYKLAAAASADDNFMDRADELLYYINDTLAGYLGINDFGGREIEINGMVHPDYRRRGVFRSLYSLALEQWKHRRTDSMLLLSDSGSSSGMGFIKSTGAEYDHTEYDMTLSNELFKEIPFNKRRLVLRAAEPEDSTEIARQNAIYFGEKFEDQELIDINVELKRGFHIFIAELDNTPIGKTHLHVSNGEGGIFGLGIKPENRGLGLGRELLIGSVERLIDLGAKKIFLQVDADNENALSLYKSVGFEETHSMVYHKLEKKGRDE